MVKRISTYFIIGFFSFTACQKEELPIVPAELEGSEIRQIEMGNNYESQVFFNLSEDIIVSSNFKTEWDLAFESSEQGWHVLLNSSKLESVHKSDLPFESIDVVPANPWVFDDISGDLDQTAIGNWIDENHTYILDRGFDPEGNHLGYKKFKIESVTEFDYDFHHANLDGSEEESIKIQKNPNTLFTQFSFDLNQIVSLEPPTEDWNLLFTHYTEIFEGGELPYLVSGVLINRSGHQVAEIDYKDFLEITFNDIQDLTFNTNIDVIGYDWKEYDFDSGVYNVDHHRNFVIKVQNDRYFKLRFLDFYTDSGEKGAPKFEFQEL